MILHVKPQMPWGLRRVPSTLTCKTASGVQHARRVLGSPDHSPLGYLIVRTKYTRHRTLLCPVVTIVYTLLMERAQHCHRTKDRMIEQAPVNANPDSDIHCRWLGYVVCPASYKSSCICSPYPNSCGAEVAKIILPGHIFRGGMYSRWSGGWSLPPKKLGHSQ